MACAIDLGEAYDIHPKNKQEVGKRLAQAALTKTYNKGTYEVPAFLGYRISGRTLILTFDQEVVAKEGAPKGFILAGPGREIRSGTGYHPGKRSHSAIRPDRNTDGGLLCVGRQSCL